jgi:hypothetical protein
VTKLEFDKLLRKLCIQLEISDEDHIDSLLEITSPYTMAHNIAAVIWTQMEPSEYCSEDHKKLRHQLKHFFKHKKFDITNM